MTAPIEAAVVVLAAGAGTRMRSDTPKVLHTLAGRSMLSHAVHTVANAAAQHLVVVLGHDRERIAPAVGELADKLGRTIDVAIQDQQLGTGHAVACGLSSLPDEFAGTVVVTSGDVPLLDADTLAHMRRAGCRQVCVGFESADPAALASMKKGLAAERMGRFRSDAAKAGIKVHGCFIFGFPDDTRESILATIDFALKLHPDTAQFYPVMVYPGTEAYEDYKARGFIAAGRWRDWLTPAGLHGCVVRNASLRPTEIVQLCDLARKRFYLRPAFLLRRLAAALCSPGEMARTVRAGRVFVKHLLRGSRV